MTTSGSSLSNWENAAVLRVIRMKNGLSEVFEDFVIGSDELKIVIRRSSSQEEKVAWKAVLRTALSFSLRLRLYRRGSKERQWIDYSGPREAWRLAARVVK